MIRLDTAHLRAHDRTGEQRVLAAILEVAAIARIAQQVDAAGQHDVEARGACFRADHRAATKGNVRIPGRSRRQSGWQ